MADLREVDIAGLIDEVARRELPNGLVQRVAMRRKLDYDGDPILDIDVVYDMDQQELVAEQVTRLIRVLRARLAEAGEDAFPLVTFMTPAEAEELVE